MVDKRIYKVLEFAMRMHEGQKRDDGQPYIVHPIAVAMILAKHGYTDFRHQATALLHDVIEDTKATTPDVIRVSDPVVSVAVNRLSKKKTNFNYEEYYNFIKSNVIARKVKIADRIHNLHTAPGVYTKEHLENYINKTEIYFSQWAFEDEDLGDDLRFALKDAQDYFRRM